MTNRLSFRIRSNLGSALDHQARVIPPLFIPTSEPDHGSWAREGVAEAEAWVSAKKCSIFDERVLKALHKKMFGHAWHWAGEFRLSHDCRGVDFFLIPSEVDKLTLDCAYWAGEHTLPPDTIAALWFFRLVQIRPFLDGNARHARLTADLLLSRFGKPSFTWGMNADLGRREAGKTYDGALLNARSGDIRPLLEFARS